MIDRTKPTPLYMNTEHPDVTNVDIYYKGKLDDSHWLQIDVLGCWGIRIATNDHGLMVDDDGCYMHEKIYGDFEIRWLEERTVYYGIPAITGF